jgi:hypothetical protein
MMEMNLPWHQLPKMQRVKLKIEIIVVQESLRPKRRRKATPIRDYGM